MGKIFGKGVDILRKSWYSVLELQNKCLTERWKKKNQNKCLTERWKKKKTYMLSWVTVTGM